MKVILLKDVAKVGQRGGVKEVSDGYALNFLIPNGFAVQATPEKMKAAQEAMHQESERHLQEEKATKATVQSVEGAKLELKVRATEKGGLFKAIGAHDVAKALLDQRRAIVPETAIQLEKPIKEIGEHSITIRASGAEARITLSVKAST